MNTPFIDIHTHHSSILDNSIRILNFNTPFNYNELEKNCSVGIHPWYIDIRNPTEQLKLLEKLLINKNIVAIGECGLDKFGKINLETQISTFESQINLAIRYQKPLIIHCVKTFPLVFELINKYKIEQPIIFHGVNNKWDVVSKIISQNHYVSLGKALLIENSNAQMVINKIPRHLLLLETDDSSISIDKVYSKASTLLNISLEELKKIIFSNFKTVFKYEGY